MRHFTHYSKSLLHPILFILPGLIDKRSTYKHNVGAELERGVGRGVRGSHPQQAFQRERLNGDRRRGRRSEEQRHPRRACWTRPVCINKISQRETIVWYGLIPWPLTIVMKSLTLNWHKNLRKWDYKVVLPQSVFKSLSFAFQVCLSDVSNWWQLSQIRPAKRQCHAPQGRGGRSGRRGWRGGAGIDPDRPTTTQTRISPRRNSG